MTQDAQADPSAALTHHSLRKQLSRHLIGSGIEVGPGHQPFELPFPGVSVRYVDRWQPQENRELFPELGDDAGFPAPHIVANFDIDRLSPIADCTQDFVIASHVVEHLAEPIGFLEEMHRVLRPGGVAVVLLPNRHRTFDRRREPTPLEHLISEHRAGITDIDDDHVSEFLLNTIGLPDAEKERAEAFSWHRDRSIHVHCWNEEEFIPVLLYTIEHCGSQWEFVDGLLTDDLGEEGFEFGFVIRRSNSGLDSSTLKDRFRQSWSFWRQERESTLHALRQERSQIQELQLQVAQLRSELANLTEANALQASSLDRLHRSLTYRVYAKAIAGIRRLGLLRR